MGVLSNGSCDANEFSRADFWALVSSLGLFLVANLLLVSWMCLAHLKRLKSVRHNQANLTKHTFERLLRHQFANGELNVNDDDDSKIEKENFEQVELPKIELQNLQQESISLSSFEDSQIIRI